jgi:hypothetical protein
LKILSSSFFLLQNSAACGSFSLLVALNWGVLEALPLSRLFLLLSFLVLFDKWVREEWRVRRGAEEWFRGEGKEGWVLTDLETVGIHGSRHSTIREAGAETVVWKTSRRRLAKGSDNWTQGAGQIGGHTDDSATQI